ncbi:MAG: hypothetical protein D8M57_08660 [Candidatus Scalindua sp. AMX11]|nr:MAG: hypothetical protein DWQ00_09860 [Candidatus Scalindua sp.]NOG84466.1 hypothetical protein [Planctomycetota bacterium]RZV80522.1 MAG: hypothetical protein EX341_10765 [Candidatus Scalindua sp. SCAELEC01]TDE65260.1 MAG: hypothetical protein D8M57_08660 [Candidatus Scalindua sp. AMX11]GJQ58467.1 MAG: hypothetical protein SCALA701_12680 [Candidatus Scalindua sp.]
MIKHYILFVFIVFLTQSHALYATRPDMPEPIEGIEAKETVTSEEDGKWTGIDVSIVGKYAEKYGRPPRDPYINTDQGDLLLFVFTFFGLVGGIVIGYNFRKLFVEEKNQGIYRKDAKHEKKK